MKQMRETILTRIKEAANHHKACAADVTLVAVSKVQPEDRIKQMLACGQRVFGENRVQEASERWNENRRAKYPDLKLHLIGPLQTNKVKDAVALFDVIETLDRVKLANKIAQECEKQNKQIECYIQVNTGAEDQKAGILPLDLKALYDHATIECGLNIVGLMCIPPVDQPAGLHFGLLRILAEDLGLQKLSMGMSGDFEQAIRFGASSVRVGSALFGERSAVNVQ